MLIFHVERRQLQGFSHLIRMPPERGLQGTSNWEKTPGEDFLERLCGSSSMGLPWDPPGDTRKHCRGKYLWDNRLWLWGRNGYKQTNAKEGIQKR